jgi:hypothetical protein
MTKKTLLEESFEEWKDRTGGTRDEWRRLTVGEWDRIRASLIASGHWHDGQSCATAKCKTAA